MKPRTLAKLALKWIEDNSFKFDCEERKIEAIKQMKRLANGKTTEENNPEDPIIEIHIGVYVPNFDYPIIPCNTWGEPILWVEDNKFDVPGKGTHSLKGVGISGEFYFMNYLTSLVPYRNAIIKVDKYTTVKRAAWVLVCTMSQILNKKELIKETGLYPLKMEYDVLKEAFNKSDDIKKFEAAQKKLYMKWLSGWINTYRKSPNTHMKVLKLNKEKEKVILQK